MHDPVDSHGAARSRLSRIVQRDLLLAAACHKYTRLVLPAADAAIAVGVARGMGLAIGHGQKTRALSIPTSGSRSVEAPRLVFVGPSESVVTALAASGDHDFVGAQLRVPSCCRAFYRASLGGVGADSDLSRFGALQAPESVAVLTNSLAAPLDRGLLGHLLCSPRCEASYCEALDRALILRRFDPILLEELLVEGTLVKSPVGLSWLSELPPTLAGEAWPRQHVGAPTLLSRLMFRRETLTVGEIQPQIIRIELLGQSETLPGRVVAAPWTAADSRVLPEFAPDRTPVRTNRRLAGTYAWVIGATSRAGEALAYSLVASGAATVLSGAPWDRYALLASRLERIAQEPRIAYSDSDGLLAALWTRFGAPPDHVVAITADAPADESCLGILKELAYSVYDAAPLAPLRDGVQVLSLIWRDDDHHRARPDVFVAHMGRLASHWRFGASASESDAARMCAWILECLSASGVTRHPIAVVTF